MTLSQVAAVFRCPHTPAASDVFICLSSKNVLRHPHVGVIEHIYYTAAKNRQTRFHLTSDLLFFYCFFFTT